jgi:hypothetical protein
MSPEKNKSPPKLPTRYDLRRRGKRRGQGRNFGQAGRGEAPEDTSNIVANVARVSEGAEHTRFGVLSGVALFTKNEALQGRNSRQGSQL